MSALETATALTPKYNDAGLIPAMCTDADTGQPLMMAWMNAEALQNTLSTRKAHFYSRSRGKQWMKGESSGHVLHVQDVYVDCDQDVLWIPCKLAEPEGGHPAGACHTGYRTCFYRKVDLDAVDGDTAPLTVTEAAKAFDPNDVY